jgi:hypothetical protein
MDYLIYFLWLLFLLIDILVLYTWLEITKDPQSTIKKIKKIIKYIKQFNVKLRF